MACPSGFDQWTFTLTVEGTSRQVFLVFCMRFDGEAVSGKVFDPQAPAPGELSDLTGTHVAIGASGLFFLNVEFAWNDVKINLAGLTFPRGKEHFQGGFVVSDRTDLFRATEEKLYGAEGDRTSTAVLPQDAQVPPESGETGTGNGQQT